MMTVPLPSTVEVSTQLAIPSPICFDSIEILPPLKKIIPSIHFLVANSIPAFTHHFCFWLQHSRLNPSHQLLMFLEHGEVFGFFGGGKDVLIRNMMVSKPFPKLERHLNIDGFTMIYFTFWESSLNLLYTAFISSLGIIS